MDEVATAAGRLTRIYSHLVPVRSRDNGVPPIWRHPRAQVLIMPRPAGPDTHPAGGGRGGSGPNGVKNKQARKR